MNPENKASSGSHSVGANKDKTPVWQFIVGVPIILAALGVAIYLVMGSSNSSIMIARPGSRCNLQQGSCQAVFRNGDKVTLSMSPRPIRERKQLHIEVRLKGIDAKTVYVNFLGQNMYMGYNRPQLKSVAPGVFAGTWTLASCGLYVEHMEWKTMVLIQTAKKRMAASFFLETNPVAGEGATSTPAEYKTNATSNQSLTQSLDFGKAPQGGDFTLQSASGPFSLKAQRGKVVLLYFGYTHCPDVCPTTLSMISQAFKELKKKEISRVEAVFVSVDPDRDTTKRLAEYTKFFSPLITGVTGTPDQLARVTKQYGAVYRIAKHPPGDDNYLVSHSANIYVIAPDGTLNTILPDATPPKTIDKAINSLLNAQ